MHLGGRPRAFALLTQSKNLACFQIGGLKVAAEGVAAIAPHDGLEISPAKGVQQQQGRQTYPQQAKQDRRNQPEHNSRQQRGQRHRHQQGAPARQAGALQPLPPTVEPAIAMYPLRGTPELQQDNGNNAR